MYIADLHIHSRYSRATSRDCTPEHLDLWARRKGIHIVGTGDFTHPAWREELTEKLEPAEDGLYVLKDEYRIREEGVPGEMIPRFVVTGEISSIYKKNGKVRKVHSLILLPGLEDAERISAKLEQETFLQIFCAYSQRLHGMKDFYGLSDLSRFFSENAGDLFRFFCEISPLIQIINQVF